MESKSKPIPVTLKMTPTITPNGKLAVCSDRNCMLWPTGIDGYQLRLDPTKIADCIIHGNSPITKKQMDSVTRTEFLTILKKQWPEWFKNVLITGLLQQHQIAVNLLNETNLKTLGSGRFGTVYASEIIGVPIAIKKVPHKSATEKGNDSGHSECYILNTLREMLLLPRISSGVVWMYQYLPGTDCDLAVMEKAKESLWARLVRGNVELEYIKSIVFQVLHTLATIYDHIPSFRHNDLKVDNVLLFDGAPSIIYETPGRKIKLTQPVTAKISDFDFACTSFVKNPKVGTAFSLKFGCDSVSNHFYDYHIFLNSLYRHADTLPEEMTSWIKKKIPKGLLGDTSQSLSYGRIINPGKYTAKMEPVSKLLEDSFFDFYVLRT